MAVGDCVVQRVRFAIGLGIYVGGAGKQQGYHIFVALHRRPVQRREAILVRAEHQLRVTVEQRLYLLQFVVARRLVNASGALVQGAGGFPGGRGRAAPSSAHRPVAEIAASAGWKQFSLRLVCHHVIFPS